MEKKRNRHQSPKKIASHTFRLVTESALTPQRALRENQPGAGRPHTLQTGVPSFQGPAVPGGGGGQQSLPTSERLRQLQQRRKSPFSERFAEDNCISREACKSPERPRPGARRRPDGAAAARARVSPGSPAAAGAHAPARGPCAPRHPGINSF